MFRVAHEFKKRHLDGCGERAALSHLFEGVLFVVLRACGDAVRQEMHLIAARKEVMHGLIDADVRLNAGD